jgi:hypothetical protein
MGLRSETRATALGRFNGAVLIAIDGKIVLQKGYGYADFSRRIRNTAETQFEIASISKMFTALAILKVRDRGALALHQHPPHALQPLLLPRVKLPSPRLLCPAAHAGARAARPRAAQT